MQAGKVRLKDLYPNVAAIFKAGTSRALSRPVVQTRVAAGFPSPAEDYLEKRLDLNKHLVKHPLSTFYVRVIGDSMNGEMIFDGDLLVVDRAEEAVHGDIIVARVEGEFCDKRLQVNNDRVRLCSANPKYPDIELTPETDWEVWGKVLFSIRPH
jgi:DNA polymerase V